MAMDNLGSGPRDSGDPDIENDLTSIVSEAIYL